MGVRRRALIFESSTPPGFAGSAAVSERVKPRRTTRAQRRRDETQNTRPQPRENPRAPSPKCVFMFYRSLFFVFPALTARAGVFRPLLSCRIVSLRPVRANRILVLIECCPHRLF